MCIELKTRDEFNKINVNEIMRTKPKPKIVLNENEKPEKVCENFDKPDILAVSTQYTRKVCDQIQNVANKFQKSTCYKILTRTTQPAHVIAVSAVFFIMYLWWPNSKQFVVGGVVMKRKANAFTTLVYLGSFATHFGAQIWMTFVSGLALYFSLPRHTFGMCQEVLFPKYFTLNTFLSTFTLFAFVKMNQKDFAQTVTLSICLVIELFVRLYLTPPLLKVMRIKYLIEQKAGKGSEVGREIQGELAKCPHYQKIHKQFRKIHMMTAIANICTMVCTFIHLNYLASKIALL